MLWHYETNSQQIILSKEHTVTLQLMKCYKYSNIMKEEEEEKKKGEVKIQNLSKFYTTCKIGVHIRTGTSVK